MLTGETCFTDSWYIYIYIYHYYRHIYFGHLSFTAEPSLTRPRMTSAKNTWKLKKLTSFISSFPLHSSCLSAAWSPRKSPTLDAPTTITASEYGFKYSLLIQDFPHLVRDAHEVRIHLAASPLRPLRAISFWRGNLPSKFDGKHSPGKMAGHIF